MGDFASSADRTSGLTIRVMLIFHITSLVYFSYTDFPITHGRKLCNGDEKFLDTT